MSTPKRGHIAEVITALRKLAKPSHLVFTGKGSSPALHEALADQGWEDKVWSSKAMASIAKVSSFRILGEAYQSGVVAIRLDADDFDPHLMRALLAAMDGYANAFAWPHAPLTDRAARAFVLVSIDDPNPLQNYMCGAVWSRFTQHIDVSVASPEPPPPPSAGPEQEGRLPTMVVVGSTGHEDTCALVMRRLEHRFPQRDFEVSSKSMDGLQYIQVDVNPLSGPEMREMVEYVRGLTEAYECDDVLNNRRRTVLKALTAHAFQFLPTINRDLGSADESRPIQVGQFQHQPLTDEDLEDLAYALDESNSADEEEVDEEKD